VGSIRRLATGYGTIAPMPRWLAVLVVAAIIALGAREARAQVFRPRTGKAAVVNKAAPATAAATTGKKAPAAEATSKTTARAAASNPKRTGPAKKRKGKSRGNSDDVKIDDEDEEDVKITDD
jgi:hypothetical protein